jgi:hypothetical protein
MIKQIEELDGNSLTGKRTFLGYDTVTDDIVFTETFDRGVTQSTFDRNHHMKDFAEGGGYRLVASIPPEVQMHWKEAFGVDIYNPDHSEKIIKLLNDGDYLKTRIHEGHL